MEMSDFMRTRMKSVQQIFFNGNISQDQFIQLKEVILMQQTYNYTEDHLRPPVRPPGVAAYHVTIPPFHAILNIFRRKNSAI